MKTILLFAIMLMAIGCSQEGTSATSGASQDTTRYNSVLLANTTGSFALSVTAKDFNQSLTYPLDFNGIPQTGTLSLSRYSAGSLQIKLFGSDSSLIYDKTFTKSATTSLVNATTTRPVRITIIMTGLTASVALSLSGS